VVLAADYYHTQLGNSTSGGAAPQPSRLAIKDAMLKVCIFVHPSAWQPCMFTAT
jgi:hypothetical protein